MEQMIPGFLEEMLKKQYGEEAFAKILAGYQARRPVTLRVNPLKADRNTVEQALTGAGIAFKNVSWYEDAMIIEDAREPEIQELPIYKAESISRAFPPCYRRCFSARRRESLSSIWLPPRAERRPRWRR